MAGRGTRKGGRYASIFLIFTAIGIAGVVAITISTRLADALGALFGETLGGGPAAQGLASLAIYVVIVFTYFLTTWAIVGARVLRLPSFHNSFYFMGFIFTLTALAASMYILARATGDDQDFQSIFTQNAIAVGTTILGLIFRNFLSFWSESFAEDVDQSGIDELARNVSTLNISLPGANKNFQEMRSALSALPEGCESVEQAFTRLRDQFQTIRADIAGGDGALLRELQSLTGALTDLRQNLSGEAPQVYQEIARNASRYVQTMNDAAGKLDGASEAIAAAIHKQNEHIALIDAAQSQILNTWDKLSRLLQNVETAIDGADKGAGDRTLR